LQDAVAAFEQLQQDGKILSWGVNDIDVPDLREARKIVARHQVVDDQLLYQMNEGVTEDAARPWYEKHGIAAVACSPFGPGSFPGPRTSGGRVLQQITKSHNATSRQVGLQFLLRRSGVFAIPKASVS
jgi:diketogulonate reductase-like aldo/keto reductase